MAAVRTLRETSLARWSWPGGNSSSSVSSVGSSSSSTTTTGNVSFIIMHDRSIDVILNNQRGEGFVKQVFRRVLTSCTGTSAGAGSVLLGVGVVGVRHGCL